MLVSGTSTAALEAEGTIQQMDLIGRNITIRLPHGPLTFDVPARCVILLNGERVKLRLLQQRDRIHLTFCRDRGFLTALKLSVTTRRTHYEGTTNDESDGRDERPLFRVYPGGDPATVGPSRA